MTPDRFRFARLNYREDARSDIAKLSVPVLILSGAEDLNVNPQETVSVYSALLEGVHPHSQFRIVPAATHGLLSADRYNYQLPDHWPLTAQARFLLSGRGAFEGDVLETLTGWITDVPINAP